MEEAIVMYKVLLKSIFTPSSAIYISILGLKSIISAIFISYIKEKFLLSNIVATIIDFIFHLTFLNSLSNYITQFLRDKKLISEEFFISSTDYADKSCLDEKKLSIFSYFLEAPTYYERVEDYYQKLIKRETPFKYQIGKMLSSIGLVYIQASISILFSKLINTLYPSIIYIPESYSPLIFKVAILANFILLGSEKENQFLRVMIFGAEYYEDKKSADLQILGLAPNVTEKEIKRQYYQLARQFHPDKSLNDTEAQAETRKHRMQEINSAHTNLTTVWARFPDTPIGQSL